MRDVRLHSDQMMEPEWAKAFKTRVIMPFILQQKSCYHYTLRPERATAEHIRPSKSSG